MATTKRKKKTAKGPTLTGLKREVKALKAELENTEEHWRARGRTITAQEEQLEKRQKLWDLAQAEVQRLEVENAELHGYINRVEIQDDEAWHKQHGIRFTSPEGGPVDGAAKSPLRCRVRPKWDHGESHPRNRSRHG